MPVPLPSLIFMGKASKIVYYKRQLHSGVNINTFLEYISSLFRKLEIFSEYREKYVDNGPTKKEEN
jgi:hypothetical protein